MVNFGYVREMEEGNGRRFDKSSLMARVDRYCSSKSYCNNCNGIKLYLSLLYFPRRVGIVLCGVDEDSGGGLIKVRFGAVG